MVKGLKRRQRKAFMASQAGPTMAQLLEAGVMVLKEESYVLTPKYQGPEYKGMSFSQLLELAKS